jgi:Icc protein
VTFICDGAVSGGWWKGPNEDVQEGFGIIDLKPDGGFAHQYFDYGWNV